MKVMRDNLIEMSRRDLDTMARAAWAVVAHPQGFTPEQLDANDQLLDDLTAVICYGPEYYGRLVPVGFHLLWKGYFPEMVEVFLTDLGEEVTSKNQVYVALARHAAEVCDDQGFGTDYKLEFVAELNKILERLWEAKEAMTGEPDDDIGDRVLDEIDRRIEANLEKHWRGGKNHAPQNN